VTLRGNTNKEEVVEGLGSGADDYLTKPFHPGELHARVKIGRRIADLHKQLHAKDFQLEEMALAIYLRAFSCVELAALVMNGSNGAG
jgi:DNA-binding response OmpR family regulator